MTDNQKPLRLSMESVSFGVNAVPDSIFHYTNVLIIGAQSDDPHVRQQCLAALRNGSSNPSHRLHRQIAEILPQLEALNAA